MPYELNNKLKNLTPYEPVSGYYRIRLDANESFLPLADEIRDMMNDRLSNLSFNRYPDPYATELCGLFADYFNVPKSFVTAGNGSDELIGILVSCFLEKGESVLCFEPDFSMYPFYAQIYEANCIKLQKDEKFYIDIYKAIETVKKNNIKMVIFSNPCNPTSVVINKDDVKRLVESVDALIVLDEAYMDFSNESLLSDISKYDNLIILRTCSKAFGMASIRLGFAVANEKISNAIKAVKAPYNLNAVTQAIGVSLFSYPEILKRSTETIISSRNILAENMKNLEKSFPSMINIVACEANFVYTKMERAEELFKYLQKESIIVRRFGNYLRITAGRNHENEELCRAIQRFYE